MDERTLSLCLRACNIRSARAAVLTMTSKGGPGSQFQVIAGSLTLGCGFPQFLDDPLPRLTTYP